MRKCHRNNENTRWIDETILRPYIRAASASGAFSMVEDGDLAFLRNHANGVMEEKYYFSLLYFSLFPIFAMVEQLKPANRPALCGMSTMAPAIWKRTTSYVFRLIGEHILPASISTTTVVNYCSSVAPKLKQCRYLSQCSDMRKHRFRLG